MHHVEVCASIVGTPSKSEFSADRPATTFKIMINPRKHAGGKAYSKLPSGITGDAKFSDCGKYRYWLIRYLGGDGRVRHVHMLNPSTANEWGDDPTVRQMLNRAVADGCSKLIVTNSYALIATDPRELVRAVQLGVDPVGPENDFWIGELAKNADEIVFASGNRGAERLCAVYEIIGLANPTAPKYHLGELTKRKQPRHPRGMRRDVKLRKLGYGN